MKIKAHGFTLLEILIALFIFTIISLLLMRALHTVINADARTEASAKRLRTMQMALLILSRDLEQAVNQPVINAENKEEAAFVGDKRGFVLTHTGYGNSTGGLQRSSLSRTQYRFNEGGLWRITHDAFATSTSKSDHARQLLKVQAARFQYLDQSGRFHETWPLDEVKDEVLPRAVKIDLTVLSLGELSQLYAIPAQNKKTTTPSTRP